ncbi:helix-turn-helix transcriptional regulator [Cryptosporangium arvum]|uniref:Transcriptional regulator, luxR family n=1 Tax=Cryptosporangium arvum DSM 44712 TaxID=927661 RepID=A0A010ZV36_9ACTN|nr:LuxR family transcriptional regulator [Cryptosporangium arvum]EXG82559.1 transcriptional regulator, luxR family [Cryptosporangium arvum DSM 44712]
MLLGRGRECEALDGLLRDVRAGRSRVLVLRGDAGIGKSALLDHVAGRAAAGRVVRVAGVEVESDIAYSGLQQLCGPLLPHLGALPGVQAAALSTALGLSAGSAPELLPLGLAVLSLLAEAASERPVVVVVDDAHWLDRMSGLILGFVARRLDAEAVALIFATRQPSDEPTLGGLPELRIGGLPDGPARTLLNSVLPEPVDAAVRERILAEARGNPLALLELPRGSTSAELAFGFGGHRPTPIAGRVDEGFRQRIAALPAETRVLLLTAAVEPTGDVPLLLRALQLLGVKISAAEPAATAGLLELGAGVRFRHPLVRSASWRSADATLLRAVHAALADATDPADDPDRRAWHRGHATLEPDEEVAGELVAAADRALARGGRAAAASFLERAVVLTPDPQRRAARVLAAARAHLGAGAAEAVADLLAAAELGPLDARQRAEAGRLRASAAFLVDPSGRSGPPLLDAAAGLATLDEAAARETAVMAFVAVLQGGRSGDPDAVRRTAEAAGTLPRGDDPAGRLVDGLVAWSLDGPGPAAPRLSAALETITAADDPEVLWLSASVALDLLDQAALDRLTRRGLDSARRTGARSGLPGALSGRSEALLAAGRLVEARSLLDEARTIAEATGRPSHLGTEALVAAHQGREKDAEEAIAAAERAAASTGVGRLIGVAALSGAVLRNGLGHFPAALAAARVGTAFPELSLYPRVLSELAEAASRAGVPAAVTEARDRLAERAAAGTPWALGAHAVAEALTGPAPAAEEWFRAAIAHFDVDLLAFPQARARLLYGEWLRREGRRVDARAALRAAHEAFAAMGAEAFADRAARELTATGEIVRKRSADARDELTSQEAQIARLALAHRTNAEIAAMMYLSPRTVEWHLRKVFTKLGITSRRELAAVLEG